MGLQLGNDTSKHGDDWTRGRLVGIASAGRLIGLLLVVFLLLLTSLGAQVLGQNLRKLTHQVQKERTRVSRERKQRARKPGAQ